MITGADAVTSTIQKYCYNGEFNVAFREEGNYLLFVDEVDSIRFLFALIVLFFDSEFYLFLRELYLFL